MPRMLVLLSCLWGLSAQAQQQSLSLDEIEAQIKRAQQAEAARRQEQAKAEELARQAAARGTLTLSADADCQLRIAGEARGELFAGVPRSLELPVGEVELECADPADPETLVQVRHPVVAGEQGVQLQLADRIRTRQLRARPGHVFQDQLADGSKAPELVVIPAGQFLMGAAEGEAGRAADEGPQHPVSVPAFALGKTEVTVAQFRAFASATGYRSDAERDAGGQSGCYAYLGGIEFGWSAGTSWLQPGYPQQDEFPAVCLSANDAAAYVQWLADSTGKAYRLPSEAELEYTMRAAATGSYPWGEDPSAGCTQANIADQTARAMFPGWKSVTCADGFVYASPVASLAANAFGLYDTIGNTWEWSADCWNESYAGLPADGSAVRSGDCKRQVLRGGGWLTLAPGFRPAVRGRFPRATRNCNSGMRIAREL